MLSSILGLPTRTVSTVIEPFLIRSGLIVKNDTGRRQISGKGREHLFKSRGHGGSTVVQSLKDSCEHERTNNV